MAGKVVVLKEYILNTSFHGYRFVAESGRHWTERVFWLICCTLSWTATFILIFSSWSDFKNNSISFVVDTNYLDWDTDFPTVVVCETDNAKNIAEVTDSLFGDPHDYNLDEVVKELVYFRGFSFYTLQTCGPNTTRNENCFMKNFSYFSDVFSPFWVAQLKTDPHSFIGLKSHNRVLITLDLLSSSDKKTYVRNPCDKIFSKCEWNKVYFDCCQYFKPMDTEIGTCYAINSIQIRDKNSPTFHMKSNKKTGPGSLNLEINGYAQIYTFGRQDVPSLATNPNEFLQVTPGIQYERHFSVKEIENEPEVKDVSFEQRKCRFNEETDLDVHNYYSFSACGVQCRKNVQLQKCGCIHHLKPNTPNHLHCNIDGINCLSKYYNELSVLKAPWSNKTGLVCHCLPSCTEIELSIIRDEKESIKVDYALVELKMDRLPTERFKRYIVKGKLDLVVSMGGATALFLGASILSFVEIFYYFIVKPLIDVESI